jgi:hypothetical protein
MLESSYWESMAQGHLFALPYLISSVPAGSNWCAVNGPFRQGLLINYCTVQCLMTLEAQSPKITTQRGKAQILHYAASIQDH